MSRQREREKEPTGLDSREVPRLSDSRSLAIASFTQLRSIFFALLDEKEASAFPHFTKEEEGVTKWECKKSEWRKLFLGRRNIIG